jgi:hypothetical protein
MAASRVFAFEVEHIRAMDKAFDAVCGRLELSTRTGDRAAELVALKLIQLVMAGERTRKGSPPVPWQSSASGMTDRCGGTSWRVVVARLVDPNPSGSPPNSQDEPRRLVSPAVQQLRKPRVRFMATLQGSRRRYQALAGRVKIAAPRSLWSQRPCSEDTPAACISPMMGATAAIQVGAADMHPATGIGAPILRLECVTPRSSRRSAAFNRLGYRPSRRTASVFAAFSRGVRSVTHKRHRECHGTFRFGWGCAWSGGGRVNGLQGQSGQASNNEELVIQWHLIRRTKPVDCLARFLPIASDSRDEEEPRFSGTVKLYASCSFAR